ncbi:Beta-1-2-xylosyltransferase 1 [Apiospora hydei]|uniref:Beta-1-2-xylosyltransferase 1 n=1 Tax=Apiospora hydei TaxID=1337664 RepID=A0ABR1X7N9_9PEZI
MWQQHSRPAVAAFATLALSTAFLTSRYQKSAAFERPFHFSVLVSLLLGLAARLYSTFVAPRHAGRYEPLRPSDLLDRGAKGHRLLSVAALRNAPAALLRILAFLPCYMFALNAFDARKYASLPWNTGEAPQVG